MENVIRAFFDQDKVYMEVYEMVKATGESHQQIARHHIDKLEEEDYIIISVEGDDAYELTAKGRTYYMENFRD